MGQTTPPSKYIGCPTGTEVEVRSIPRPRSFLEAIEQCVCFVTALVCLILVFGLALFGPMLLVYMVGTSIFSGYSFDLEHASVLLTNVTSDPQTMNSEWFLRFSVDNDYFFSNLDYQYINVTLDCLGGNSTVAVIPPFRQKGYSTIHVNATVHAPLPRFKAAGVSLPFDVHIQPFVKYKNWLDMYSSRDYSDARCNGMKVDILPSGRHGTMSGGPFSCGP